MRFAPRKGWGCPHALAAFANTLRPCRRKRGLASPGDGPPLPVRSRRLHLGRGPAGGPQSRRATRLLRIAAGARNGSGGTFPLVARHAERNFTSRGVDRRQQGRGRSGVALDRRECSRLRGMDRSAEASGEAMAIVQHHLAPEGTLSGWTARPLRLGWGLSSNGIPPPHCRAPAHGGGDPCLSPGCCVSHRSNPATIRT